MSRNEQLNQLTRVKSVYQSKIVSFLLLLIFCFLIFYVPLDKLGVTPEKEIWNYIYKLATSGVFTFLLRIPLFATDPLATGKNKHSVYFRMLYPSAIISNRYSVSVGKAQDLWFDFFNSWGDPTCRYHSQWKTVLNRTYNCRLIYYFSQLVKYEAIIIFLYLAIVTMLNYFEVTAIKLELIHYFFFLALVIVYFVLIRTNRIRKNGEEYVVSGCWYKYKEISEIEHSILEREILVRYPTYQEAVDNLDRTLGNIR